MQKAILEGIQMAVSGRSMFGAIDLERLLAGITPVEWLAWAH
jgi:hypothetical protein